MQPQSRAIPKDNGVSRAPVRGVSTCSSVFGLAGKIEIDFRNGLQTNDAWKMRIEAESVAQ
jgi:hypothetical protein